MIGRAALADLAADLRRIVAHLEHHAAGPDSGAAATAAERPEAAEPSPVDLLVRTFGLTAFERDVLLLCAGVELDADCAAVVARLQDGAPPTFALALAALPEAHWTALLPTGPLRYWRLIELGGGPSLVGCTLRIDERILHFLLGLQFLDERLGAIVDIAAPPAELVPSHCVVAARIAAVWQSAQKEERDLPIMQICGRDLAAQRDIAASACALAGSALLVLDAADLPDSDEAFERLQRLWEREALLVSGSRMIVCGRPEEVDGARDRRLERLLERGGGPLILSSVDRRPPGARAMLTFDVPKPAPGEQLAIWRQALGEDESANDTDLRALIFQFDLDQARIRAASADAIAAIAAEEDGGPREERLGRALWDSCRDQARARTEGGVRRIEPVAAFSDLVLPERELDSLHGIAAQVRWRPTVHGDWGWDARTRRLGLAALFEGPSGTGKTLAAEVIARDLRLDLLRIDLGAVVDKNIGETGKKLRRVFDAAEAGGAVLLFEEADALFGKGGEVVGARDRHADIAMRDLLQRIETYRGLAIFTTRLEDNLDDAFLRRLRFVVRFPFPDQAQRLAIWSRSFPEEAPVGSEVDCTRLAQLEITGGSIRNIVLNAAFQAAAEGRPVSQTHLKAAALAEYERLDRTLTEAETRGWE